MFENEYLQKAKELLMTRCEGHALIKVCASVIVKPSPTEQRAPSLFCFSIVSVDELDQFYIDTGRLYTNTSPEGKELAHLEDLYLVMPAPEKHPLNFGRGVPKVDVPAVILRDSGEIIDVYGMEAPELHANMRSVTIGTWSEMTDISKG